MVRTVLYGMLWVLVWLGVAFAQFLNSRDVKVLWEAPADGDVAAFDLAWRLGVADWDTLRLDCTEVSPSCTDGVVASGTTCQYPLSVESDGRLAVRVRCVDLAGNVSAWADTSAVIDTVPPGGCIGIRIRKR